jgi:hypothetical protein
MTQDVDLDRQAQGILRDNDRGGYTIPRAGLYPFQWNWDSAFVALGFATFDIGRAWSELDVLLSAQWPNGMVPHIIFHQHDNGYFPGPEVWASGTTPPTSCITQPPVAASVALSLWQREGKDPAHPRLRALFPKLLASHRWFHRFRDPLGQGLVLTVHNWETGRDNNVEWDDALARVDTRGVLPYQRRDTSHVDAKYRPTQQEYDRYVALIDFGRARGWDAARVAAESPYRMLDVGMTMIWLRANRDLATLARALGEHAAAAELEGYVARAEGGVAQLWDDELGVFCSKDLISGTLAAFVTSASFLAFYAGVGTDEQRSRLLCHLTEFARTLRFMVPSLAPGSRSYDPVRYWRGPVWLVVNHMIAQGLHEAGEGALARRIWDDGLNLVRDSGFYEYFSPETGEGCGGDHFSWTAAMWLIERERRGD